MNDEYSGGTAGTADVKLQYSFYTQGRTIYHRQARSLQYGMARRTDEDELQVQGLQANRG
jgi:hypothetical protein